MENLYFKDYHEIMRHQSSESPDGEPLKIRGFEVNNSSLCSRNLRESSIRESTGCTVVTIKRSDGEIIINPHSQESIAMGDTLVVMGSNVQLEQFGYFILEEGHTG